MASLNPQAAPSFGNDDTAQPGSSADIVLRGHLPGDLEAMFRLDVLCFEAPFRFSKADMGSFAEARRAHVLVAVSGEELAGFSIVHRERAGGESVGYLLTLDIAPEFRRRGLAQTLLQRAEHDARKVGCVAMLLHVFAGNAGAIALYERLGYTRLRAAEHFYSPGLHAWVYRKPLAATT